MSRTKPMVLLDGPDPGYRRYSVSANRDGCFEFSRGTPGREGFRDVHEYRIVSGTLTAKWVRLVRTEPIDLSASTPKPVAEV